MRIQTAGWLPRIGIAITALAAGLASQHNPQASGTVGETQAPLDDLPDFAPTRRVDGGTDDRDPRYVPDGNPYVLAFVGGDYTPEPGIDRRLIAAIRGNPLGHTYGYVMIQGRLNAPAKMAKLKELGLELYGPHTWQSVAAKIPFGSLDALRKLPWVRWVGYARPEQKVEPLLARAMLAQPNARFEIDISTFASDINANTRRLRDAQEPSTENPGRAIEASITRIIPNGPFQAALAGHGFEFRHYTDISNVHVFTGKANVKTILALLDLDFVSYIELKQKHQLHDDASMAMISQDRVRRTYDGSKVTVGVIDSGLDTSPWHRDYSTKLLVGWRTSGTTAFDDPCTHGTHVGGTIFGAGAADARYRGALPRAGNGGEGNRIFIGRYFHDGCRALGNVSTLYGAFRSNFVRNNITNPKPRVINNSWGASAAFTQWTGTESGARTVDAYVQDHNQCYVFSAGNSGVGVGSPGSAKNALTVASVDDLGTSTGDTSSFSRSGVADLRRKPEVAAPGRIVTSLRAGTTSGYSNKSGTSMAAPHVTAAIAGAIQHYSFLDYKVASQQALTIASAEYQGRKSSTATQGWGMINAYKMHFTTSSTRWSIRSNSSHITRSGRFVTADVAIPSNAVALYPVIVWTEGAAGSGAKIARVNNVRLYLDAPPYDSRGNIGESVIASSRNNKMWGIYTGTSLDRFRGKTVRFKMYGQSVSGLCKVSVCIYTLLRNTSSPGPNLTLSRSPTVVRPGNSVTATATWSRGTNGDEFDNARITPSFGTFSVVQLQRTTADGIRQVYTGTSHPSYPYPSLTSNGITVGQGTSRSAAWILRAPSANGTYFLRVNGTADPGATKSAVASVCVDGQGPRASANLRSSTHTRDQWSNRRNLTVQWTPGADQGCGGIARQRYVLGQSACPTPTTSTTATSSSLTFSNLAESDGYHFAVRSEDRAGNIGAKACIGPFKIDFTKPVTTEVEIDGGAGQTSSLDVRVRVAATDNRSGVQEMQFSSNGSTWSPFHAFSTSPQNYNLASFGGNANEGTKRVFVRVRDAAGNVSDGRSDTIEYVRLPRINSVAPQQLPTVHKSTFRLTGSDFLGVTAVQFGPHSITSNSSDDWFTGWFRVLDDSTLDIAPPQALVAGGFSIRLRAAAGLSNSTTVNMVHNAVRTLHCPDSVRIPKSLHIAVHRADESPATINLLTLSASARPLNIPGLISLQHGGNAVTIIDPSYFVITVPVPFDPTSRIAVWELPTVVAGTFYFQSVMIDPADPHKRPITTSTMDSCRIR